MNGIIFFIEKNADALYVSILGALVVAIIIAVCKFFINDKLIYVKEIKTTKDNDICEFINLYNKRIDKKYKICSEEILSFIGNNAGKSIKHHLYICKKFDKTIGFIKFMVSVQQRYIFIAYAAIDENDKAAQKYGMNALIKNVIVKHFKKDKIDKIYIEIERGRNGGRTSAYGKLVSRYMKIYKKNTYMFDCDYIQPNMPDDDYDVVSEEIMTLVFVTHYEPSHYTVNKDDLIEVIKTIYFDIYCPSCNDITNCCELYYSEYLNRIIKTYESILVDTIRILPIR